MLQMTIYVIWASVLFAFMRGIINHLPVLKDFTDEVIIVMVVTPIILSLPALIHKFCLADYLFYLFNVVYYLACYIFYPENTEYLNESFVQCIFLVYPYYFFGRVIDIDKSYNAFVLLSAVCVYMNLFYYTIYMPGNKVVDETVAADNMHAAYQLLPHVTMMLWTTLRKFRIWKAVTSFLGFMLMLSFGTRGPLACLAFFGIVYFFFYMKFKGAIYVKAGIIATVALVIVNLRDIIFYLVKMFTGLKLSTRILDRIIDGGLDDDSFRSVLRDRLYDVLANGDHFFGLGLFGCRNYGIIYPHYLPLDIFCTHGYLIGTIMLLLLAVLVGWAFWINRGTKSQEFILFLLSLSVIKLMLSGTYVNELFFYMLIGYCVKELLTGISNRKTT